VYSKAAMCPHSAAYYTFYLPLLLLLRLLQAFKSLRCRAVRFDDETTVGDLVCGQERRG